MLKITRILRKKIRSPDELSVVPRYGLFDLLHGSSQGSEEFDHFNAVFITGSEDIGRYRAELDQLSISQLFF